MAAGILRTPAGAATGRPAGSIAALRATALGSNGLAAALACGATTPGATDALISGAFALNGAFVAIGAFLVGAFFACTPFADCLGWILAGCPLCVLALAEGEEERALALGVARFFASAFLAARLLGVTFRTMSIVSL